MNYSYKNISFFSVIITFVSLLYLIFINHFPILLYGLAQHDDFIAFSQAYSIIKGNWLGDFNNLTLAKGPGFSFFIVMSFILGLSIQFSIAFFNLFSLIYLINTLKKLGIHKFLLLITFTLILFHPALIPFRIIRDVICPSIILIFISFLLNIFFIDTRVKKKKYFLFGIFLGFGYIIREDWHWVIPTFVILFLFHLRYFKFTYYRINYITFILSLLIIPIVISAFNYFKYNTFTITDFTERNLSKLIKVIDSIDYDYQPYMIFSEGKRDLISSISPSFRKINPYFSKEGLGWRDFGCLYYKNTCNDIGSGWIIWAIRDAAQRYGYYKTPMDAADLYRNITDEIESACRTHQLKCDREKIIPYFYYTEWNHIQSYLLNNFFNLFKHFNLQISPHPRRPFKDLKSDFPSKKWKDVMIYLSGTPYIFKSTNGVIDLGGWVTSDSISSLSSVSISCQSRNSSNYSASFDLSNINEENVTHNGRNISIKRFHFSFRGGDRFNLNDCNFKLGNLSLPILNITERNDIKLENDIIYFDKFKTSSSFDYDSLFYSTRMGLVNIYKNISMIFSYLFLFVFIHIAFCFYKKNKMHLWLIFIFSSLIFNRVLMLLIVDITMFSGFISLYQIAVYPLLIFLFSFSIFYASKYMFIHLKKIIKIKNFS